MNDRDLEKLHRAMGLPRDPERRPPKQRRAPKQRKRKRVAPVIPCPVCGVRGGSWCVKPEGKTHPYVHRERIQKNADFLRSQRVLPGHYGARSGG